VDGLFPVQHHTSILEARVEDDKVSLRVREEGVGEYDILADYVVAGTGYAFDVDRIAFLDPQLAAQVERWDKAPKLNRHFESSVSGLYFIGPITAPSFGPLVRFVAGSHFAVRAISGHLARTAPKARLISSQLTPSQPAVNSPQVLG
jgi:hypothetical protein